MDLDKIEKLVSIIEKSTLTEFSIEEGEMKISMTRKGVESTNFIVTNQEEILDSLEEEIEEFITSPIVGTFYSAVSPETPAFVRVGETIKKGQPVCIVEAMKLMNEINCDFDCEIEAILVSNEQKVEYGQPLFRVKRI
ncbi:MAG: acetyl-CoA carboxylase biotin carboxyl carrier protein [Leptotrichiaceae bacterium]|jgi:acetyl-CoA carboxylase biotin carboxyl carrier protein|nr:acetyl-CoA carboxylase biotin carboxyl carrier protein [Leptotrichiaceae bacterium]MBP6282132.1 acetyl-CoA carboxylase biotin carboxyl carrier protein [Leptotrichiaceae bacterium]MBP7101448.1 acetyl-CoA carboxylase biotin carboxyl carrier protein [Leptotrichiaceae bacterium]